MAFLQEIFSSTKLFKRNFALFNRSQEEGIEGADPTTFLFIFYFLIYLNIFRYIVYLVKFALIIGLEKKSKYVYVMTFTVRLMKGITYAGHRLVP